ncbi:hypothetical protein MMC30_005140 [Trapelia coarctata]|nr:hypothetical protein [Trapelia coarctata]
MDRSSKAYSTLELVKHDRTAQAPERDHEASVPAPCPQIPEAAEKELDYGSTYPKAIPAAEREIHGDARLLLAELNAKRRKSYCKSAGIIITLIVLIAIAVGLGIGLHARSVGSNGQNLSSPVSAGSSTSSSSLIPSSSPTPSGVPTPLANSAHGLLNDTSMAAVTTSDGHRHAFFQEKTGIIRESIYISSTAKWLTDVSYIIATDARNYTPMSTFGVLAPTEQIYLFYIDRNDHITYQMFDSRYGIWRNSSSSTDGISNLIAAPDSRILSATPRPDPTSDSFTIFLFYESSNGSVVWLKGLPDFTFVFPRWTWIDQVIDNLLLGQGDGPIVPGPLCTSGFLRDDANHSQLDMTLTRASPDSSTFVITDAYIAFEETVNTTCRDALSFSIVSHGSEWSLTLTVIAHKLAPLLSMAHVPQTDCIMGWVGNLSVTPASRNIYPYGYLVNGTALVSLYRSDGQLSSVPPESPFHFARLASTVPTNGTVFYMYHQIDNVTFAEDKYDMSIGHWASTNITIATA